MSNSSFPGYPSYSFFPGYSNGSGLSGSINSGEERPKNPKEGEMFFDMRYNKPIYYNGSNWVDSEGNADIKIAPRIDAGYIIFKDYNILVIPIVAHDQIRGFLVPLGDNNYVISYDPWRDIFYESDLLLDSTVKEYITFLFDMQLVNGGDPNILWMLVSVDQIVSNALENENWRELFAEHYGESYKFFIIADNIPESRIIATDETNLPLMEIARSAGWVEPTATIMTQSDAEAVIKLGKKTILINNHTTENITPGGLSFTLNVWYDQNNEKYYDVTSVWSAYGNEVEDGFLVLLNSSLSGEPLMALPSSNGETATAFAPIDFFLLENFDEFKYFTNVTTVDDYTFDACENLKTITIPDSVTSIGDCAFLGCEFDTMIIGSGIVHIVNQSAVVTTLVITATTPPELSNDYIPFGLIYEGNDCMSIVYVPQDSVDAYRTATGWSQYTHDNLSIIFAMPTGGDR